MEVILKQAGLFPGTNSILHVCGGDPKVLALKDQNDEYSPRMWRWSLILGVSAVVAGGILHVCGGDPSGKDHVKKTF